ncbi:MAG: hypothetical protein ACRDIY_19565 [Chloroflexota bacterium]
MRQRTLRQLPTGRRAPSRSTGAGPRAVTSDDQREALLGPLRAVGNQAIQRLAAEGRLAGALTSRQGGLGNQAIQRLLADAPRKPVAEGARPSPPALQRVKSPEERAKKQRRVAGALVVIGELKDNLKGGLKSHVFDATPVGGGAPDKDDPTGLHAYKNGKLPGFVSVQATEGSTSKVHQITWKNKDGDKTKASTMFPTWMPAEHVCTLIALRFPEDTGVVAQKIDLTELAAPKEDVKTYIQHGMDITIAKSGDTVYPTM